MSGEEVIQYKLSVRVQSICLTCSSDVYADTCSRYIYAFKENDNFIIDTYVKRKQMAIFQLTLN